MNTDEVLAMVFGLCAIASILVIVTWWRVLKTSDDKRYKTVALGMLVATFGVTLLSLNRVILATTKTGWPPSLLLIAGLTILVGKSFWMKGATMGRSNFPFYVLGIGGTAWLVFCLWWFW